MREEHLDLFETTREIEKIIAFTPNKDLYESLWALESEPRFHDFFARALCIIFADMLLQARQSEIKYERLKQSLQSLIAACEATRKDADETYTD